MGHHHHFHGHHHYVLVNVATGQALDNNVGGAPQLDHRHPRPFMWQPVHSAHNHQWEIKHVEGDYYTIAVRGGHKALDGNINAPQVSRSHPMPFLWDTVPSAQNHQWKLHHVEGDKFVIINRENGLALDGNVGGAQQHAPSHPAPFLWQPVHHAANHQWVFHKV